MRRSLVALAVLASLATPAVAAASGEPPGQYRPPIVPEQTVASGQFATPQARLADALRFRRDFGLSQDLGLVQRLLADPTADRSYGTALTGSERDTVDRRFEVAEALAEVDAYVQQHAPETFAGIYTDHGAGGLVYVGFTADGARHLGELRKVFAYPDLLRTFPAQRSQKELQALSERLSEDLPALWAQGLDVRMVGVNTRRNGVDVWLGAAASDATADELAARYGNAVTVAGQADPVPTDRTNDGVPFKGGIEEYDARASCTSAFVVRRATGSALTPWDYFMLTAGHCFPLNTNVSHFIYSMGRVTGNTYPCAGCTTTSDAAVIDLAPGTESRQIMRDNAPTYINVTGQLTSNADYRDLDPVCQIGKTTGHICGVIRTADITATYNDGGLRTLTRQVLASYDSCPGDSGGVEYRRTTATAMGVVPGRNDGAATCGNAQAIFTKITEATRAHNVQVNR